MLIIGKMDYPFKLSSFYFYRLCHNRERHLVSKDLKFSLKLLYYICAFRKWTSTLILSVVVLIYKIEKSGLPLVFNKFLPDFWNNTFGSIFSLKWSLRWNTVLINMITLKKYCKTTLNVFFN